MNREQSKEKDTRRLKVTSNLAIARNETVIDNISANILENARAGDVSAFRQVVESYKKSVYAVTFKFIGDKTLAEEATQITFIRLFRSFKRYDTSRKFFTYLYRITANVCCDLIKREARFKNKHVLGEDQDTTSTFVSATNPEKELESRELFESVQKLVNKLSLQQRMAYVLRDLEGFEIAEIAKILRCRQTTVRSHLSHARRAIAEKMRTEYPELL